MKKTFLILEFAGRVLLALAIALAVLGFIAPSHAQAATLTVCASGCNYTTIAAALAAASAGDTISIGSGTFSESGLSIAVNNLTITGAGKYSTIIDAGDSNRVFNVGNSRVVTIRNLTIQNGLTTGNGGGIQVNNSASLTLENAVVTSNQGAQGGGIFVGTSASATLNNVLVSSNNGTDRGGGLTTNIGSNATVTVYESAFIGNTSPNAGGLRVDAGSLTVDRSTFKGNIATTNGGAIYLSSFISAATLDLKNSTLSGNSATVSGGAIYLFNGFASASLYVRNATITGNSSPNGGGIYVTGTSSPFNVKNSIVLGNTPGECSGTVTSLGFNLFRSGTGAGGCPTGNSNDTFAASPGLGLLDMNGGQTATHALLFDSPAIDTGSCEQAIVPTDQRGVVRADLAPCDIGAFERTNVETTDEFTGSWPVTEVEFLNTDVKMTVTSGDPGRVTILRRPVYPGGTQDTGEYPVIWTLTAVNPTFSVDVDFCFTETLNANTSAYRWNETGQAWTQYASTVNNNCVTVTGVSAFSPWTIAYNSPTAIKLSDFEARSAGAANWAAVVAGLLLLAAAGLAARRYARQRA